MKWCLLPQIAKKGASSLKRHKKIKTIYSQPSSFSWPLVSSRSRHFIGVALYAVPSYCYCLYHCICYSLYPTINQTTKLKYNSHNIRMESLLSGNKTEKVWLLCNWGSALFVVYEMDWTRSYALYWISWCDARFNMLSCYPSQLYVHYPFQVQYDVSSDEIWFHSLL